MKFIYILIIAAVASLSGFLVHVFTVEWLPDWISSQMEGIDIQPSWDVRYWAAITSVEYGLGATAIYALSRSTLIRFGNVGAILGLTALFASINGALIRQPLMDAAIGNPLSVVLVQNGAKWLIWLLMAVIVVLGYEWLVAEKSARR